MLIIKDSELLEDCMKKIFFLILFTFISLLYAKDNKEIMDKNSNAITDYVEYKNYFDVSTRNEEFDFWRLKTVIYNGDIDFVEKYYPCNEHFGVLSQEELSLLRNLIYAKHGYNFKNEEIQNFFKKFSWYKPSDNNDVILSNREEIIINDIKNFEKPDVINFFENKKSYIIEQFNGGADQRGFVLTLNKDGSFYYKPAQGVNRLKCFEGKWEAENGYLNLAVEKEVLLFGGYITCDPNTPFFSETHDVYVSFKNNPIIKLPVQAGREYYKSDLPWIKIGFFDCQVKK